MTKEAYLKQLEKKLKKLPAEEIEAALEYYAEYFDEAGIENTNKVISELGSPAHVAAKIVADYAMKNLDDHPKSAKKSLSAVWIILLAIIASPIALPVLIVMIGCILGFLILSGAFILAGAVLIVSLMASGLISLFSGFTLFTQHWPTALFFTGIGLITAGIGILLLSPLFSIIKNGLQLLAKGLKRLFDKIMSKRKGEQ
ncbi:MAG: DUF1700 domain-containing protein [Bacillus sp. (in: firmicutes)]